MFELEFKRIGGKIAYFRKLKRYTQKDLATKANISVSYLSRIERGVYTKGIPVSTLIKISRALEISTDKLLEKD